MKLTAEFDDAAGDGVASRAQIEITRDQARPDAISAVVGGETFNVAVRRDAGGAFYLIVGDAEGEGGRVYECRVEGDAGEAGYQISVRGRQYLVRVGDPKSLAAGGGAAGASSAGGAAAAGAAKIVAPMPGKVVKVLVEVGAGVEAGDGVVIVEAMKMQNEMKAPRAGVVAELKARAGATVGAGEVLAIIKEG